MSAKLTSKFFLAERLHVLVTLLSLTVGFGSVFGLWSDEAVVTAQDWRTFAGIVVATSATMVGFLATIAALLYAIDPSPLMQHVKGTGHIRRILFDLFAGVSTWIAALATGLLACLPSVSSVSSFVQTSLGFSVAGLLLFLPLGRSFWLLLTAPPATQATELPKHDWDAPTELD